MKENIRCNCCGAEATITTRSRAGKIAVTNVDSNIVRIPLCGRCMKKWEEVSSLFYRAFIVKNDHHFLDSRDIAYAVLCEKY